MLPKSWKKSLNNGFIIPTKMRFCNECNDKRMCNRCNNQNIENKEIAANIDLIKRQAPNELSHLLPFFKE